MTKTEEQTLRNIVARLKQPNLGCSFPESQAAAVAQLNAADVQCVGRLYLETWMLPALELLLPGERRDPQLAQRISS